MDKVSVLGVKIDNVALDEAVTKIEKLVQGVEPGLIVTANPEIIMLARSDEKFARYLNTARLVTADGIGVVIAAKMLGTPLKGRVAGIDLVTALLEKAATKNYRFYFLGAKPGIAEKAAANICQNYPGIEIVGVRHGYFEDDSEIIDDIIQKKPDFLLVALGMGKQEKWIVEKAFKTGVPVSIGVGGSFDVYAGEVTRAPLWMQRAGLEWLYRLMKQPTRFVRMLQLPLFLFTVWRSKFKQV